MDLHRIYLIIRVFYSDLPQVASGLCIVRTEGYVPTCIWGGVEIGRWDILQSCLFFYKLEFAS